MPDWDADSDALKQNLNRVLQEMTRSAAIRERPTIAWGRRWQRDMMNGLTVPDPRYVGAFRGEPGLERVQVRVGSQFGVSASQVAEELASFEIRLQNLVAELDLLIPPGDEPDEDQQAAIVDVCAWVHAEWVRIHPFANGNGRVARLWANSVAMRYGLPPSSDCVRGRAAAMARRVRRRCRAIGSQQPHYSGGCWTHFWMEFLDIKTAASAPAESAATYSPST